MENTFIAACISISAFAIYLGCMYLLFTEKH
jgi:hypothetical protein